MVSATTCTAIRTAREGAVLPWCADSTIFSLKGRGGRPGIDGWGEPGEAAKVNLGVARARMTVRHVFQSFFSIVLQQRAHMKFRTHNSQHMRELRRRELLSSSARASASGLPFENPTK